MTSTVIERCIGLLRHGETTGGSGFRGRSDDPLTALGWRQMLAAVEQHRDWEAIVTSPLSRCAAFAEHLGNKLGIPVHCNTGLQELDFGLWEGRTAAEIMQSEADALTAFWKDPYAHPPPQGETLHSFEQRVLNAWQTITADDRRQMLVIAHAGVIRMLLCYLHAAPRSLLLQFAVPHASLHRIVAASDGVWRLASPATEGNR